jgi:hypothetical protein
MVRPCLCGRINTSRCTREEKTVTLSGRPRSGVRKVQEIVSYTTKRQRKDKINCFCVSTSHKSSGEKMCLLVYQAQTLSCTDEFVLAKGSPRWSYSALTKESQEPVHKLMPSLLTPRQLTRFSCPLKEPTLSPRRTSQTCDEVSVPDHVPT